jgi:hypothetical protein
MQLFTLASGNVINLVQVVSIESLTIHMTNGTSITITAEDKINILRLPVIVV